MSSKTCIFINPVETRHKLFMSELRRRGWEVREIWAKEVGVPISLKLPFLRNYFVQLGEFWKIVRKEKPAFIFSGHQGFPTQVPFLLLARFLRERTLLDYYYDENQESMVKSTILSRLLYILLSRFLNSTDVFITFRGQEPFLETHHINKKKVFYLETCPNLGLLNSVRQRNMGLEFPDDKLILTYHGGLPHHKIQWFLPVYKELLRGNRLHMFLIGMQTWLEEGREYAQEVKRCIDELGLEKYVTLTQELSYEDVIATIYHSDLYIALLNDESRVGLTEMRTGLLEAMSLAKPCVHAKTEAIVDYGVFEDGENIILLNPHDIDGSAQKLSHYLNNKEKLVRIGQNARKTIEEHFDIQKQFDEFLAYLSSTRKRES